MKFRVLPGLPAAGPLPEQFSVNGRGTHREGFVVDFLPEGQPSWVGNFQPGGTNCFEVLPVGACLLIIAGGDLYLIDPNDRRLIRSRFSDVATALVEPETGLLVLCGAVRVEAWDLSGPKWQTRRFAWDGIDDVRIDNGKLMGNCWSPLDEGDHPFSIDLATGLVEGGSYSQDWPD